MAKAAIAEQQPDLLGGKPASRPKPKGKTGVAVVAPKKAGTAVSTEVEQPTPTTMMQAMMQAVLDPRFDAAKLQLVMREVQHQQDREAEQAFNRAMIACQKDLPTVVKDGKGDKGHRFAKLETMAKQCLPIIHQHGFSMSWSTEDSPIADHYRIVCYCSHADSGWTRKYQWDIANDSVGPEGKPNKTKVQGFGSTMSYGQRYGLKMMFNITVAGEDTDGGKGVAKPDEPRLSQKQMDQLTELLEANGKSRPAFLRWAGVQSMDQIPAAHFDSCVAAIKAPAVKQ